MILQVQGGEQSQEGETKWLGIGESKERKEDGEEGEDRERERRKREQEVMIEDRHKHSAFLKNSKILS